MNIFSRIKLGFKVSTFLKDFIEVSDEVVENKAIIEKARTAIVSGKVQITKENAEDFFFILGELTEEGIKELAMTLRQAKEVQEVKA